MIPKSSKNTNLEDETNIYLVDFMTKESNLRGKESLRSPYDWPSGTPMTKSSFASNNFQSWCWAWHCSAPACLFLFELFQDEEREDDDDSEGMGIVSHNTNVP